ncbi:MAG: hypothetical protein KA956_14685, partial [Pyrinomonadaceae bacterium]|nr:hypothetical protein [Pyrinomonadaceae bacterium]
MKAVVSGRLSGSGWRRYVLVSMICAAVTVACGSIPSLETAQCSEARDHIKRFYSFHFGNDMTPSTENLKAREQYLTARLFNSVSAVTKDSQDYFTAASDFPKAFRVGECKAQSPEKTEFQVLMLWRDDKRSEQKEIA